MKIGFTGTVSVGKTTLVKSLAELPEFRDYITRTERSQYLRDLGIPLNTDSTILGQTVFLAERCSELLQPNIITDRTIVDVMAFTSLSKSINIYDKEAFECYAECMLKEYDFIFYVSPKGIDIEDNGVRTIDPDYRTRVDNEIKHILIMNNHLINNMVEISGSNENRIQTVLETLFRV